MLSVKILGCNGLYPDNFNNTSGYLVENNSTSIVLDMGSGVFSALKSYMPPENVDAIYISHLHFDHISDLGVYNYYLEALSKRGDFRGKIKLIIKKSESAVYRAIEGLNYFEICNFEDDKAMFIKDFCLKFYKMKHPEEDYAVVIDNGDKKLCYLGDTNVNDNLKYAIKGSDVTIFHAPFLKEQWDENKPHLSVAKALSIAKEYNTFAICSHFMPGSDLKKLKEEALSVSENFVFAKQGEVYNI